MTNGDVPIVQDVALVNQLYRVPVDESIGRDLFAVMAGILAHVLRIDKEQQAAAQALKETPK
jgi:type III secretion system FlhB-like substrate exporter